MKIKTSQILIATILMVVISIFSNKETLTNAKRTTQGTRASVPTTSAVGTQDNSNLTSVTSAKKNKAQELGPEIAEAVRKLVNTSHEGLVEEKTEYGEKINLKGRFKTAPVATIDEEGIIIIQDYTSPPKTQNRITTGK